MLVPLLILLGGGGAVLLARRGMSSAASVGASGVSGPGVTRTDDGRVIVSGRIGGRFAPGYVPGSGAPITGASTYIDADGQKRTVAYPKGTLAAQREAAVGAAAGQAGQGGSGVQNAVCDIFGKGAAVAIATKTGGVSAPASGLIAGVNSTAACAVIDAHKVALKYGAKGAVAAGKGVAAAASAVGGGIKKGLGKINPF